MQMRGEITKGRKLEASACLFNLIINLKLMGNQYFGLINCPSCRAKRSSALKRKCFFYLINVV